MSAGIFYKQSGYNSGVGKEGLMREEQGFSLVELLIVVTVIGVILTFAIPNLLRSRAAANEGSAMQSLHNLVNAQLNYSVTLGSGRFATAIGILSNAGLIDDVLGSGTKNGYSFVISTGPSNDSFNIVAKPVTFGTTGNRYFCSDEDSVIYVSEVDDCSTMISAPIGAGGKKKGKKGT